MSQIVKKTKIVATLGPASASEVVIRRLLQSGVNVFRLNFSHGTHGDHRRNIAMIRACSKELGVFPAILGDLQGPKIRTGATPDNRALTLKTGSRVSIVAGNEVCTESRISIDYPRLVDEVEAGQSILINDGAIRLKATAVSRKAREIVCIVESGGTFSSRKGVNLPDVHLSIPSLTRKDKLDLDFILRNRLHYVALSFVRSAADLVSLGKIVARKRASIKTIAKIEKPDAARNIDEILDVCDGIMVARGDLGVETSPYEVPILQKTLIRRANLKGKLVIVATQMLESMIQNGSPTRAESSDVANAIIDGTDATMLSGETAMGAHPVESVRVMAQIAGSTESSPYYPREIVDLQIRNGYPPHAVAEAAAWASRDLGDVPVVVFTISGDTALYLSKIRNQSPIIAFTVSQEIASALSLAWNVRPFVINLKRDLPSMLAVAERVMIRSKLARKGDLVVVVSGSSPVRGATSFLQIKRIGEG